MLVDQTSDNSSGNIPERIKKATPIAVGLVGFGLIWEIYVRIFQISPHILPSPTKIVALCFTRAEILIPAIGTTALESFLGLLLGTIIAYSLALCFAHVSFLGNIGYPYAVAIKAVPIVAISPLLILWFGNGLFGKVIMAMLICFFPVLVNVTTGLRQLPEDSLELFESLSATRRQILLRLRVPSAMPFLFSSLRVASTLAVVGAIVAELAGADRGIGFILQVAQYRIDTPLLFAALSYAALLGLVSFGVVVIIEQKVLSKLGFQEEESK